MQCESRNPPARQAGFSLAELLLALTLGSLLVTSMASGLQLFSKELEHVRDEPDTRLDEAAMQVSEKLRDAWWVDAASSSDITLADPLGNTSRLQLVGDELRLTRPSGAQGALLTGVSALSFGTQTTRRLRDAAPIVVDAPWYARPAPTSTEFEISVKTGDEIALGFAMSDDAPDFVDTVAGVNEERLDAALHEIVLKAAFVDGDRKEFCHLHAEPPHNPTHPGYEGNKLFARLHEARAPDDGRPYGPALGAIEIPMSDLPLASLVWWDTVDDVPESPPNGVAWGWWKNHEHVLHHYDPIQYEVSIPLAQFGFPLERGKAYTIVFSVKGWDELRLRGVAAVSADGSGTAMKTMGGDWLPQNMVFPFLLQGDQTCTQTQELQAVSRVSLDIEMLDGRKLSTSAGLLSQTSVDDAWHGVVPGELGWVAP